MPARRMLQVTLAAVRSILTERPFPLARRKTGCLADISQMLPSSVSSKRQGEQTEPCPSLRFDVASPKKSFFIWLARAGRADRAASPAQLICHRAHVYG